jgi:hypothetical protein
MSAAIRPAVWAPPLEGFHYEATAEDSLHWRIATDAEHDARRCRWGAGGGGPGCGRAPVAALNRGWRDRDAWWFYCEEHLYGRWIEDGQVMHWRLVADEA